MLEAEKRFAKDGRPSRGGVDWQYSHGLPFTAPVAPASGHAGRLCAFGEGSVQECLT